MNKLKRVCVFCASSTKINNEFIQEAQKLGELFVKNNIALNYGGGAVGLMGAISNSMLEIGGQVKGIIPQFMVDIEWAHPEVKDMVITETMAERKELLVKHVDAVVALPGGTGTLEELSEVISNKKLGIFNKPIIIVNINGFYDSLIKMLDKMIEENFMRKEHRKMWIAVDSVEDVINAIVKNNDWHNNALEIAAV